MYTYTYTKSLTPHSYLRRRARLPYTRTATCFFTMFDYCIITFHCIIDNPVDEHIGGYN